IENPPIDDSVAISHEIGVSGQQVLVTIFGKNSAPTFEVNLPIEFNTAILEYDTVIVAGTRLENAELSIAYSSVMSVIVIEGQFPSQSLAAGNGTLVILSFYIKSTAQAGQISPLDLFPFLEFSFVLDNAHGSATVIPQFTPGSVTVDYPSGVDDYDLAIPKDFALDQNYPNPFNPETIIEYSLPTAAHVQVTVYNILGQNVINLVNEYQSAGNKRVVWTGTDASGRPVNSGVYFYRLTTDKFDMTRKMVLMK
ncbi:MAG: T9SS type A sorting domain-containing protein, partial [Desulfobacteraceae bacterium]|nr:T9SS type A sorting domain-containing protein [Desulfobacteraceae bacterium]